MSTNLQEKEIKLSKQVRVPIECHRRLKVFTAQRGMIITHLMEQVLNDYLESHGVDVSENVKH